MIRFQDSGGSPISDPSWVSIRVRCLGIKPVAPSDYTRELTFTFPDRTVVGFDLVEMGTHGARPIPGTYLATTSPSSPASPSDNKVVLPAIPMNPGDQFHLSVLLTGVGLGVRGDGSIVGGKVREDTTRRLPVSRRRLVGIIVGVILLVTGTVVLVRSGDSTDDDPRCASGHITVVGSSAFNPPITKSAKSYEKLCPHAKIDIDTKGTHAGSRLVSDLPKDKASAYMTLADGYLPTPGRLRGRAIAIVYFSVVVNRDSSIPNLTYAQLQGIFRGEYKEWSQLGGPKIPIRIISRGAESGTRQAFERHVLEGGHEGGLSSDNCLNADRDPNAPIIRCERSETSQILDEVNRIPGAIGYADARTATQYDNLVRVRLNGLEPEFHYIRNGYRFWTTEWTYTLADPPSDSLLAKFRQYLSESETRSLFMDAGYTPCREDNAEIWQECNKR